MWAMSSQIVYLKDLPRHQTLRAMAKDYPQADLGAVELYIVLLRLVNDMIAVVEGQLSRHGLSRGRLAILMVLRHEKEDRMCAAELSRYCGVSRPTMAELLRGLIRAGLVRREPVPGDRRSSIIRMTDKGRGIMKRVMPTYYRKIQEFSAGLEPAARRQLIAGLRAMMESSDIWRQGGSYGRLKQSTRRHTRQSLKKGAGKMDRVTGTGAPQ
jgi:DNA-binding MarR family transcriptional regulator